MLRRVSLVLVAALCLLLPAIVLADAHDPKRIMADEVMEKLNAGEDILFLDTRTTHDWKVGSSMITNAIRVKDNEHLKQIVRETPKERFIVTYCTWPNERSSAGLARNLIKVGYENVYPLEGGLKAWMAAGYPSTTKSE